MSVYEHTYRPYEGPLTPQARRFLVIPRHAYRAVFKSKLFIGVFALSVICTLVLAIMIYLPHNANALGLFGVRPEQVFHVGGNSFRIWLSFQTSFAFLLTVLIGPVLISRDLTNNALPLYLSRPFSRGEYLVGKASVLLFLLSLMTWVPGELLFLFQAYLSGAEWTGDHAYIAVAIFVTSAVWIVMLTLASLMLSAWIKWRLAASGALFAMFTIPLAIATMISALFRTPWSYLFSPSMLLKFISDDLFRYSASNDLESFMIVPPWAAWAAISGFVVAMLWLLSRRVRAYEVVV
jgi:ABC-type transport system involved in multi-copper enzyme maturation permease subunit